MNIRNNLANFITIINLNLGMLSVVFSVHGFYYVGLFLIIVAGITDRFDGIVARKFSIESEFGKQLDSMSDIVSFGIAPGLIIFLFLFNSSTMGFALMMTYIVSGVIRLSKYNTREFDGFFRGLPITLAGVILALFSIIGFGSFFNSIVIIIISGLMISDIKLKKI